MLQSSKLINKINRRKDLFFLNEDMIDMSIINMIPYIQNSPPSKIHDITENQPENRNLKDMTNIRLEN